LCQCILLAHGPAHVCLEEDRTDLLGPAVMLIPAGTVHSFKFRAETHGYVLTVDLDRLLNGTSAAHQAAIQTLFVAPRIAALDQDPGLARRLLKQLELLEEEFRQPDSLKSPVCTWLASSVLAILAHGLAPQDAPDPGRGPELLKLRRFKELIETHHLEHWPVQRYAAELLMSETRLNRLGRRLRGVTAFNMIQQRLALEARRRLLYGGVSVNAIAAELGFKDPAYFSRFFRRHSGLAPHEFRRHHAGG
jgi:AraC family transcriptional activator of pobA